MKIDELMIGNILKCVWDDEIYKVVIVDYRGMVYLKNIDKEGKIEGHECLLKSFQPIPITKEWLKKNGFEKRYEETLGYYYYTKETKDCILSITIRGLSDGYFRCYLDNGSLHSYGYADIQYIHQLQNLLNILNIKEEFIV